MFLILRGLGLSMDAFVQWPTLVGYFYSIPTQYLDDPVLGVSGRYTE